MKRYAIVLIMLLAVAAMSAQRGQPTPAQIEASQRQTALEKSAPEIPYDVVPLLLKTPSDRMLGETTGVALNSQKHIFVYTRSGNVGPARGATAAQLFEFDPTGRFIKEWGQGSYGFSFAHDVKVDKDDNVWVVDEGSNMVMKFNPQGYITMVLGRKAEAIDYLERFWERGQHEESGAPPPVGGPNSFNRPTDVTWDLQGNIFVSDGYGNSRVAKFTKDGDWVKALGTRGNGIGQFSTPHTIASDAKGNIYVGDRGNNRIQVFDPDLNPLKQFTNVRAPWAICITPPPNQFLYSSDAGGKIYKLDLDGKLLGTLGTIGKRPGQFYWVHQMACPSENEIYTGEAQNWRVQHLMLHPEKAAMQSTAR